MTAKREFEGLPDLILEDKLKLSKFIFHPHNKAVKKAFEKAAGGELLRWDPDVIFISDKRENVAPAKAALEELAKELKLTIDKSNLQGILNKLTP